jgi:plasmid replication initiation protein
MHQKNKSQLFSITKSNQLMSASYYLTAEEQRLLIALISKINPMADHISANDTFFLTVDEFKLLFKKNKTVNVYQVLNRVASKLYSRSFTLKYDGKVIKSRWVSEVGYIKDEGCVYLKFSPLVIEHITQLKRNFTSYKLLNVQRMESAYGLRIYELIVRMKNNKNVMRFSFEELKILLGVEGKYKKPFDFKKKVLDAAKMDINKHSDLYFNYEELKKGRRIVGFYLKFKEKPESEKPKQEIQELKVDLSEFSHDFSDFNDIEINDDNDGWLVDDIDF